jgi:hypothetical protein
MAAHDIKPGIAGYRDRIDLLKDLERTGKLKDLDEGMTKDAMMNDAEKMSLEQFCDKYGDEDWVKEFYHTAVGTENVEESGLQAYLGKKKYGEKGMQALQQAGREGAGKEEMAKLRAKFDKLEEVEMEEGVFGNIVNKAKSMFTKPGQPAAPAPAAPAAPVAAKAAPGAVAKGGTMDMTKKVTPTAKPAVAPAAKPAAPAPAQSDYSPQELAQINKDLAAMNDIELNKAAARTNLDPTVTAAVKAEVARRKGVAEDLDANQKRVGQLGPTEKVKNNNIGKLVGANESVELSEMDKSQPSSDRGGESSGNPYAKGGKATPAKAKDAEKDAEKVLNKSMDKAHKKDVKEGQEDLDAILRLLGK